MYLAQKASIHPNVTLFESSLQGCLETPVAASRRTEATGWTSKSPYPNLPPLPQGSLEPGSLVRAAGKAAPHTTLASHQVGHALAGGGGWADMPRVLNDSRPSPFPPSRRRQECTT